MRGLVAPAFTAENVRKMSSDIYHVANNLQNKLATEILNNGGSLVVNACELMAPATLDVIGRVAFGHDFNATNNAPEGLKITHTWKEQNEMGQEQAGFTAMLVLRLFPWITSLPLEAIQAQGAVAQRIREIAKGLVSAGQVDEKGGKDLMSILRKLIPTFSLMFGPMDLTLSQSVQILMETPLNASTWPKSMIISSPSSSLATRPPLVPPPSRSGH